MVCERALASARSRHATLQIGAAPPPKQRTRPGSDAGRPLAPSRSASFQWPKFYEKMSSQFVAPDHGRISSQTLSRTA